jgi:hypothetical protein
VAGTSATNQALRAWQSNDFDTAEQYLDLARSYGGEDEDVERLQSNLDVISGKADSGGSAERRVRELANAKTLDAQNEQLKAEEEAKQALRAGDERSAQEALGRASGYARSIAVTEQKESEEQKDRIATYDAQIEVISKAKAKSAPALPSSSSASSSGRGSKEGPSYRQPTEINFEGLDITGELSTPRASMAQAAPAPAPSPAPQPLPLPAAPEEPKRPAPADPAQEIFGGVAEAEPDLDVVGMDGEALKVIEKEFLAEISSGRSYQSAVQMVPGVAATRTRNPLPQRAERRRDRDDDAPSAADSPIATAAHGALTVEASAFTPALPLDALTLSAAQALLPAGAFPTLTLHIRPERRSDGEVR